MSGRSRSHRLLVIVPREFGSNWCHSFCQFFEFTRCSGSLAKTKSVNSGHESTAGGPRLRPQHKQKQTAEIYDFWVRASTGFCFGFLLPAAVWFASFYFVTRLEMDVIISHGSDWGTQTSSRSKRTTTLFGLTSGVDPLATRRVTFHTHSWTACVLFPHNWIAAL